MATFDKVPPPGKCQADYCLNDPNFEVRNGDLVGRVCTRHLTDLIELDVEESQLTYWNHALEVKPLREDEDS